VDPGRAAKATHASAVKKLEELEHERQQLSLDALTNVPGASEKLEEVEKRMAALVIAW